jgi:hypothetical protein
MHAVTLTARGGLREISGLTGAEELTMYLPAYYPVFLARRPLLKPPDAHPGVSLLSTDQLQERRHAHKPTRSVFDVFQFSGPHVHIELRSANTGGLYGLRYRTRQAFGEWNRIFKTFVHTVGYSTACLNHNGAAIALHEVWTKLPEVKNVQRKRYFKGISEAA